MGQGAHEASWASTPSAQLVRNACERYEGELTHRLTGLPINEAFKAITAEAPAHLRLAPHASAVLRLLARR